MRHARLAARHAISFKQTHLRPAQAKAIADCVVNFFGRGDAVFDQPQTFAPYGLEEPVGNMGVDFFSDMQRIKANGRKRRLGALDVICACGGAWDHFDQRQQIHWVKGMTDHDLFGVIRFFL